MQVYFVCILICVRVRVRALVRVCVYFFGLPEQVDSIMEELLWPFTIESIHFRYLHGLYSTLYT